MIITSSQAALTGIAALFHDFGKASALFQLGLTGKEITYQPTRHEWVSLRLFAAFVLGKSEQQWLQQLTAASFPGSAWKTESMVTPVFATPILTTSWLA